jgi:Ca2+-binding EF-hand superfamily protein
VVYEELKGKKDIKVHHKEPNKKKISSILRERKLEDYDPLLLLFEFMRQENFRLLDLFRTFDKNHDNMISKQELKDGFLVSVLLIINDKNHDNLISKQELKDDFLVSVLLIINDKNHDNLISRQELKDDFLVSVLLIINDKNHDNMISKQELKDGFLVSVLFTTTYAISAYHH